jgi:hypothetical protein
MARIAFELSGDALGSDAAVLVRASATEPFTIQLEPPPLLVRLGAASGAALVSEPLGPARHVAEAELVGWVNPRPLEGPGNSRFAYPAGYGNRMYPFLSSALHGRVAVEAGHELDPIVIGYSDPYRPGWQDRVLRERTLGPGTLAYDSQAREGWRNVYCWPEASRDVEIFVPLRLAGPVLSRAVGYPVVYLALALAGIALAAALEPLAVWPATLAVLVFLLERWTTSERPHRLSLLSALYLVSAVGAVVWSGAWLLFGEWALILSVPYAAATLAWSLTVYRFTRTGVLPRSLTSAWRALLSTARGLAQRARLRERD